MGKLLIAIEGDWVAPRFDLTNEVIIISFTNGEARGEPKNIILERASDDVLCQMIIEEEITDVVCGGIEELHYNFLVWKKVAVIDRVIAGWQTALQKAIAGTLKSGDVF